jgi:lysozyme
MKTNAAGVELIKNAEGLRLESYLCPAGVWTIGYGHTKDVLPASKITAHQADAILEVDLDRFEREVSALAPGANENEFSALVCFAFNLGAAALRGSTLLKKFLAGDKAGAAAEFMKWQYAAGKVLPGLVKRRAAERELFLKPVG